ncbi:MAG: PhoU domain-containing protein [Candidatus Heimdallarchaeota archaeon]
MNKRDPEKLEVRKLQVTGGSTYILSLPKKWVTQMGLEKGSNLALMRQDDNSLLITPEGQSTRKPPANAVIEIAPTEDPDSIIRKLVSTYLVGYNVISIKAKKTRLEFTQRNTLKEFTRKMLMGTEILGDFHNELNLKVVLSYSELSVQDALKRMRRIAASMHQDAIMALKELDHELARGVIAMDNEVDRFSLYIIRQIKAAVQDERIIHEIGLATGRDCLGYRLITKLVERTADHAVEIAKHIETLKTPLEPKLFQQIETMSTSAISVFNEAIDALFEPDFNLANKIVQEAKQVAMKEKELVKSTLKRSDAEETSEVSDITLIIESIRRAAEYASDIAEIILNLTIDQVVLHHEKDTS